MLGAGVLAAVLASGCRTGGHDDGAASVRLINAVPDAGGLDVSVNGKRVWKQAEFRSNTGYKSVSAGTYPVQIDADGLGTTLLTKVFRCLTSGNPIRCWRWGRQGAAAHRRGFRCCAEERTAPLPPGEGIFAAD